MKTEATGRTPQHSCTCALHARFACARASAAARRLSRCGYRHVTCRPSAEPSADAHKLFRKKDNLE